MPSPLPRRNRWVPSIALFPIDGSLPRFLERVGFRIALFEACSAFTHVTACILARPLKGSDTSKASAASSPPRLLRLLPAGATFAGWASHPLKDRAFARRTENGVIPCAKKASPPLPPCLDYRHLARARVPATEARRHRLCAPYRYVPKPPQNSRKFSRSTRSQAPAQRQRLRVRSVVWRAG